MTGDNIKKNNSGFSLIEMVVAVSIFIFVIIMVTSIFQNSIVTQKNAIATQNIQEGMRYAIEVISKEIRSASRNINEAGVQCQYDDLISGSDDLNGTDYLGRKFKKVYNYHDQHGVFYFRNREGKCVYYRVESGRLMIDRDGIELPISPVNVSINNFTVDIEDDDVNDFHTKQPNVTLVMDMESDSDDYNDIKLQTTISSRYYE